MSHDAERAKRVAAVREHIDQVGPSGVEDLAEAGFGGQDVLDLLAELAHVTAERDEARALKVPPSVDELLAAKMAGATARAERDAIAVQVTTLREAQAKAFDGAAADLMERGRLDRNSDAGVALLTVAADFRQRAADLRAGK